MAVLATALPAAAAVVENIKREPYAVSGSTDEEARADINAKRPGDYDAKARWYFRWRYTYRTSASGCSLERVIITLDLTLIEPALRSPEPAVQRSFDDYLVKLRLHENGHADIARATAKSIDTALTPLTAPTCDALGRRANETAQALVATSNQEQVNYDARTQHGATQGARWPRPVTSPPPDRSQYQSPAPQSGQPSND